LAAWRATVDVVIDQLRAEVNDGLDGKVILEDTTKLTFEKTNTVLYSGLVKFTQLTLVEENAINVLAVELEIVEVSLVEMTDFEAENVLNINTVDDFEDALDAYGNVYRAETGNEPPVIPLQNLRDQIGTVRNDHRTLSTNADAATVISQELLSQFTYSEGPPQVFLSTEVGELTTEAQAAEDFLTGDGKREILVRLFKILCINSY